MAKPKPSAHLFDSTDVAESVPGDVDLATGKRKMTVTGKKGLKATEAYPDEFGYALMEAYMYHAPDGSSSDGFDTDLDLVVTAVSRAAWEDLHMDGLAELVDAQT